jgi:hypothetical protein
MAVIIGSGTQVTGHFSGECVISVNWNYNPNVQRFYCLGETSAHITLRKPTYTMSLTLYSSGTTPVYDTEADVDCSNSGRISAGVSPAACEGAVSSFSFNDWVVTSYGYNKDDAQLPSQESWSLQRWSNEGGIVGPTYTIRGVCEGTVTEEVEIDSGIVFDASTVDSSGIQGSVSGGQIGRADKTLNGVVISVGGSTFTSGLIGNGSVSIPYTPMWM